MPRFSEQEMACSSKILGIVGQAEEKVEEHKIDGFLLCFFALEIENNFFYWYYLRLCFLYSSLPL